MSLGQLPKSAQFNAYYRLNGNSTDDSGNGNNGTDTAIAYGLENGKFGEGALFDGTTSFINLGTGLNITGELTISIWTNVPSGSTYANTCAAVNKGNRSTVPGIQYMLGMNGTSGGNFRFSVSNGITQFPVNSTFNAFDGNWHNIIGVFIPNTSISIYIDGKLNAQNTTSPIAAAQSTTKAVAIGRNGDVSQGFYPLNGKLCEIIIEDRSWTASEIRKYYTQAVGKYLTQQ